MKICVISYDFFGYDKHIIVALEKQGIIATHIDISKHSFRYRNVFERAENFLCKVFLKKNLKQVYLKKYIFKTLNNIGHQDKILVIRPDLISKKIHLEIKKQTSEYICYLYDSANRFKVNHLLKNIFTKIYSFDLEDVAKYGFLPLTNYMFLAKMQIENSYKYKISIVMSEDPRINILKTIATQLEEYNFDTKFIIVGSSNLKHLNENIEFRNTKISPTENQEIVLNSEILLDLVRKDHNGLSFRIFEAMAMQRKLITNNKSVKKYDFYNENNILVIEDDNLLVANFFFETAYEPIPASIYEAYSVKSWTAKIFNLS